MTQQIVEKTETPAPAKKKSDQNEKLSQANGKKSTMPTPVADEWSGLHPTQKDMGLIQLTLDKGVKTTVVGTFYGLDFEIENEGYMVNVFFDYYNRRLKVLDYDAEDYTAMIQRLAWLAESNKFDKVFVKASIEDFQQFLSHGFMMEGVLRYYFHGEDAYVLSRFSSTARVQSDDLFEEAKMIEELIYNTAPAKQTQTLPADVEIIRAGKEHIPPLVMIYRSVFETYPSPLTSPDYIKSTMERNVIYRLAMRNGEALAAASAEIHFKHANAELTDCATIPQAQSQGLMKHILTALENDLQEKNIITAYTLARAMSLGMNRVFFRLGYEFSGRLINNCDIFGQFEDMNIWVKRLRKK